MNYEIYKTFEITTNKHLLKLELFANFELKANFVVCKELFAQMCANGCPNYNLKYSCPPFSPDFNNYITNADKILVILLKIDFQQFANLNYKEYHKLRIGNAVIKPRMEKLMRHLEKIVNSKFMGTGACRLCKPCQKKICKPCKKPLLMRYSLESLGVDCNKLTENVFGFPLLRYQKSTLPAYTAVISGLPIPNSFQNIPQLLIQINNYFK